jgi:hypothetical protein
LNDRRPQRIAHIAAIWCEPLPAKVWQEKSAQPRQASLKNL